MTEPEKELIKKYFACVAELQDQKIVRSDKVLGDLGEWICVQNYDLKLETSGRHPGYDGKINEETVQVKVHNSPKGTNLSVGNPEKYNHLIVLIGPNSLLRIGDVEESFYVYRFTSCEVKKLMKSQSGYYCAKGILEAAEYDEIKY